MDWVIPKGDFANLMNHVRTSFLSEPARTSLTFVVAIPSATARCILRGGNMLQQTNRTEARDLEWSCQAVSPMSEPYDSSATFHCGILREAASPDSQEQEPEYNC